MDEKPKRMSHQELIAFIKSLPPDKLQQIATRASQVQRGGLEARCEDFFDKMDLLLPCHDASRREAHQLLTRLRAGRPNLPQEGV
ncbi:hypothetical protein WJ97_14560 [Burkholderia ubonensis]|uniref:hypothetical protein n=1 Tax=Burkholderia ubonensis TaxID=101571 RepID=UPI00075EDD12|nr:hypothetical protein [Burkholderia ubonensis]KVP97038.1 hypothetical protein WJ97_14560 [Burkholderia ubonensis]